MNECVGGCAAVEVYIGMCRTTRGDDDDEKEVKAVETLCICTIN